ncbi:hypothetical protein, partial [Treponema endosymbiont of Eucomonympha sp.]|uniref:hypothetical protein n=1 Tax=Treponema endosymbiont of Eucomonympha sp. TaxID=1580831 RepID=UPI001EE736A3
MFALLFLASVARSSPLCLSRSAVAERGFRPAFFAFPYSLLPNRKACRIRAPRIRRFCLRLYDC